MRAAYRMDVPRFSLEASLTSVISFTGNPVAQQIVSEGDGETLVINSGPATVYFGDDNSIRASDTFGVVPITANSYFAVNGEKSLYACVIQGDTANLQVISGGLNFFLPVTSLTIPYGATGQRIVINPPGFPGSIVGYNPAGLIQFVISPTGYLLYDATGGAFQHLFIAMQNFAGNDTFGNPFSKGIRVGPQTGPQVLLAGGNPAFVSWPLNDAVFSDSPAIFANIKGAGTTRYAASIWESAQIPVSGHTDRVLIGLNTPNADGSSSANAELVYYDDLGRTWTPAFWDRGGFAIVECQQLTAADPSHVATSASPAIPEVWRDMRPLQNGFVGSVAGYLPPQYRKIADGTIQFAGYVRTPPTAGNYNNVPFTTVLPAYQAPNLSPGRPQWCVTDAPAAGATPVKIIVKETGDVVFVGLPTSQAQISIGIWGSYPLANTGQILS